MECISSAAIGEGGDIDNFDSDPIPAAFVLMAWGGGEGGGGK